MAGQLIEVPGQGPVEFPEGMSDADIVTAIKKISQPPAPKTLWDRFKEAAKPDIFNAEHAAYELGGKVTDVTGSPALGVATNVAAQAIPMFVGGGIGKTVAPTMEPGARWLMQSALKPSAVARESGKAERAITTLLDEGINVTKGGAEILRGKVNALQNEVTSVLERYPHATVDKERVLSAFNGVLEKAMKQGTPQDDIAIINKAMIQFTQHPLLQDTSVIPVKLAQELKQGIWRKLGDKSFGAQLAMPQAARDSQKAIGSGLRQGIEEVAPEVAALNAKSGDFLNAMKLVEQRSGAAGNQNIIGLGTLSPSLETFLVWMLDRYPAGKSILARMIHSGTIPQTTGQLVGGAIGMQSGQPPRQQ